MVFLLKSRYKLMTRIFSRNPSWLKRFVIAWVIAVWVVTLFIAFDIREKLNCKFTDFPSKLNPTHANRGPAATCAQARPADEIATYVPQLLTLIGDESKTTQAQSSGLYSLEHARPLTKFVSDFAQDAIKKATPRMANVEPIVIKMVERANQVKPRNPKTAEHDQPGGEGAGFLLMLLVEEYSKAGFGQEISAALIARAGEITNDAFWRVRHGYEKSYAQYIFELTRGKSPEAVAYVAKHEVEQAIESKNPPQISPLPEPTMLVSAKSSESAQVLLRELRGQFWSLRGDQNRTTAGWSTIEEGSTAMCREALPVLCISAPESNDLILSWIGLDRLGRMAGVVDARIALTTNVLGVQLTSRSAGDALCKQQRGASWRMAEHHDSLAATLPPNAWRLVYSHYAKGSVLSARTSDQDRASMLESNFWVASSDAEHNCWAR
jgi:hypothetical protein